MGTILLLEDEESVNRGITFTLEREGHTILSCSNIRQAQQQFAALKPDMLICDINLPDGNGLDFIRKVREAGSTYIICLTARDGEMDFVTGYSAGADDYVAKPFSLSVLSLKVQAYFERSRKSVSNELTSGNLKVNLDSFKVWREDQEILLTKNEWKMIQLFLRYPGQILSREQILEQLFDVDGEFFDDNTIAVYIRRLREKIEQDVSNPQYIKNIRGIGYVWSKDCSR